MFSLISGLVALAITGGVFATLLPRGGQRHRWVDTAWESYIAVALCAGVALSFTLLLSGIIELVGK